MSAPSHDYPVIRDHLKTEWCQIRRNYSVGGGGGIGIDIISISSFAEFLALYEKEIPEKVSKFHEKYFPFNEVAGKSRSGSRTANCNIHKSHYNQSINEDNLDTWHKTHIPQTGENLICCVFPKFPESFRAMNALLDPESPTPTPQRIPGSAPGVYGSLTFSDVYRTNVSYSKGSTTVPQRQ